MKLVLNKGWKGKDKLISEDPTEEEISDVLNSLDWQDFNSVQLFQDSKNWIDVSGNLGQDGLAIVFEEHGTFFVSDDAPKSISILEKTLKLYLRGDQRFKNIGFSSAEPTPKSSTSKTSGYDLWKIQYEAQQKIDKRNQRVGFVAAILVIVLFGSIINLWFNDDLKFVGHETEYKVATVTETKMKYGFKGKLYQLVKYEFEYQGKDYIGFFRGTRFTGKHRIGDRVKVKFSIEDPSISKRVATMQEKY